MTLEDLQTGQELDMPTPFDALVYASHPTFKGLPDPVLKTRQLLIGVMGWHGFSVDPVEWWHFNRAKGRHHELFDLPPSGINEIIRKNNRK
jgi:D-alanyl-D-alanine dipeptidase